jgi:hypothetical protein
MISEKDMTNKDYISRVAESKAEYHKQKAKMPFEEKLKIIVDLQKIDLEMIKNNKKRKSVNKLRNIWRLND